MTTSTNRLLFIALLFLGPPTGVGPHGSQEPTTNPARLEPYVETIPGTLVTFEMVPVPGASGAAGEESVGPFWISRTEVTWDAYDVWMLGLDTPRAERRGIDAESRPSRPYGAPDRGFGHAGFAAISVTHHAAREFAGWLAAKTGRGYRLPTAEEWRHACRAGGGADGDAIDERAWHAGNAARATHPVGSKQPDALGLFDILGNAGEWAVDAAGEPALLGGSYRDAPEALGCDARAVQTRAWNATDPQVPKSTWWLSDGPFAGFRVVRDASR